MNETDVNAKKEYRQLNLVGFTVDAQQPLALFKDTQGESTVPLWLDVSDVLTVTADLVSARLSGRPGGDELLDSLLETMGLRIREIRVDGVAGKGYDVSVYLNSGGDDVLVRVGLVTALLTAIRYKLPIGISAEAIATSEMVDKSGSAEARLADEGQMLALLERLRPEDMGKYPM